MKPYTTDWIHYNAEKEEWLMLESETVAVDQEGNRFKLVPLEFNKEELNH